MFLKTPIARKSIKTIRLTAPARLEEMLSQMGLIRRRFPPTISRRLNLEGYEADDLIASVCRKAKTSGLDVVIISSDKDLLQLVEDGVSVFDPKKDKEGFVLH